MTAERTHSGEAKTAAAKRTRYRLAMETDARDAMLARVTAGSRSVEPSAL